MRQLKISTPYSPQSDRSIDKEHIQTDKQTRRHTDRNKNRQNSQTGRSTDKLTTNRPMNDTNGKKHKGTQTDTHTPTVRHGQKYFKQEYIPVGCIPPAC